MPTAAEAGELFALEAVDHFARRFNLPEGRSSPNAGQRRPKFNCDHRPLPAESVGRIGFAGKPLASTAFGRLGMSFCRIRGAWGVCRWPTSPNVSQGGGERAKSSSIR